MEESWLNPGLPAVPAIGDATARRPAPDIPGDGRHRKSPEAGSKNRKDKDDKDKDEEEEEPDQPDPSSGDQAAHKIDSFA